MHVHKIVHGDDFDNNDISIFTKLVMHGYNVLNAIWTEIKTYDFLNIFGDRRIHVLSPSLQISTSEP